MVKEYFKYPRLYLQGQELAAGVTILLAADYAHYLGAVMRRKTGDLVRLFNGQHGEWMADISALSKKEVRLVVSENLRSQPDSGIRTHLLFTPLKKNRMDFIIEKCTELGVTDFHPVITNRTEVRDINNRRLLAQITGATEQSERLEVPLLHDVCKLDRKIAAWQEGPVIFACLERYNAPLISEISLDNSAAFLVGPVGGFDAEEREMLLSSPRIAPCSLGENVLRAETACMVCAATALRTGPGS